MKRILTLLLGVSFLWVGFVASAAEEKTKKPPEKIIGIVMPLDHIDLQTIISGFKEAVSKNYPGKVRFEVEDAEHDLNIQRAILQKFINQKVDLIAPLGTSATQMAISMVKNQPIIGLAANFPPSIRDQNNLASRFTAVPDEIDSAGLINFVHSVLPQAKKITLVYSTEDKVIKAVNEVQIAAKQKGLTIQPLMIANLGDLYASSQRVDSDSSAIFILKDILVSSGINTLVNVANKRHLPLITCDEGTVSKGAAVALGVEEKQIGIAGGELAARVLNGDSLQEMPIQSMKTLIVFVNEKSAALQGLDLEAVKAYAKQQNYLIKMNPTIAP